MKDSIGQTPLHYAVRSFSWKAVKALLEYKSSRGFSFSSLGGSSNFPLELESENMYGQTALAYAMMLLAKLGQPKKGDEHEVSDCDNLVGLPYTKVNRFVRSSFFFLDRTFFGPCFLKKKNIFSDLRGKSTF